MTDLEKLENDFIFNFGWAYKAFGLSKLMGHVVALLLFSPIPISLEDISKRLKRSKGPVSQITRRLRDKNLIRKVYQPESRKDFYEIDPEIFENAFRNRLELIKNNRKIANQFMTELEEVDINDKALITKRLSEMHKFYELMGNHYNNFLNEWETERNKIYKK